MAKWKNPYVIRVEAGPRPYKLCLLVSIKRHEPKEYRQFDEFSTMEKALKAKHKAYERSQK